MKDLELQETLIAAGLPQKVADCLVRHFAQKPHTHGPTEVFVDSSGTDLDDWSDGVEERLGWLEVGEEIEADDEDED